MIVLQALGPFIYDFVHVRLDEVLGEENPIVMDFLCQQLFQLSKVEFDIRQKDQKLVEDLDASTTMNNDDSGNAGGVEVEDSSYLGPVDVLMAYQKYESSLAFLASLCKFMPDLPKKVEGKLEEEEDHFSADLVAFHAVLNEHEPRAESLEDQENRTKWVSTVDDLERFYHRLQCCRKDVGKLADEIANVMQRLLIVRCYLKHMCHDASDADRNRIVCIKIKRLNLALKSRNLKTGKDFGNLVNFLVTINDEVGRHHFGSNSIGECIVCQEDLREPVKLPCGHCGCKECLEDYCAGKQDADLWICPEQGCKEEVPKEFAFASDQVSRESADKHSAFKRSLNAFFLDVLQDFVFHGDQPPESQVVERLMSFVVTKELPKDKMLSSARTKQISPFAGHCIDSTPVIRSFILQLLLRGKTFANAQAYLDLYLEEERKFVKEPASFLELCLLVVYCLEDYLFSEEDKKGTEARVGIVSKEQAFDFMRKSTTSKYTSGGDSLENVAMVRLALSTCAHVLHGVLSHEAGAASDRDKEFLEGIARRVQQATPLAENIKVCLTRFLVSRYRRDIITEWRRRRCFSQLMPRQLLEANEDERLDAFLVLDNKYKRIRDSLRQALAVEEFEDHIRLLRQEEHPVHYWSLALYFVGVLNKTTGEKLHKLADALETPFPELAARAKNLWQHAGEHRDFFPTRTERDESILTLLFHLEQVLANGGGNNALITSLQEIVADPVHRSPYLPTMPQDETVEVTRAASGVTKWYRCSKGHIYGVGDCGHPVGPENGGRGTCPDCKAAIGGTGYNRFAVTGLSSDQAGQTIITDQTQKGHILGRADQRRGGNAERELTRLQVAITRSERNERLLVRELSSTLFTLKAIRGTLRLLGLAFKGHQQKPAEDTG